MSPGMGPLRMRSRPRKAGAAAAGERKEAKAGAWDLWKALPRARPYLAPYRRHLVWLLVLTVLAAVLGLAEPWPLAVILNEVLHQDTQPSGIVRAVFGRDPTIWVVLVSMVLARFLIIVLGNGFTVWNHYLGREDRAEHGPGPPQRPLRPCPAALARPSTTRARPGR